MNIVYMGSPACAIAPLEGLLSAHSKGEINLVAVVSQPAKVQGRGRKKHPVDPPVAEFAKKQGLLVMQPSRARDADFLADLRALDPDVVVTAAYGQILSDDFLAIPKRATINIHPSRLPKYRGATPVQAAILAGECDTAISVLFTVKALDAGAIILQKDAEISPSERAGALTHRLFAESKSLLLEAIERLKDVNFKGLNQNERQVSVCQKIEKEDGLVKWNTSVKSIDNKFRAYHPWPGSTCTLVEKSVLLIDMRPLIDSGFDLPEDAPTGTMVFLKLSGSIAIRCLDGWMEVQRLKPAGSRECDAKSFWNGYCAKLAKNEVLAS